MIDRLELPGWEIVRNQDDPSKDLYFHNGKPSSRELYEVQLRNKVKGQPSEESVKVTVPDSPDKSSSGERKRVSAAVPSAKSGSRRGRPRKADLKAGRSSGTGKKNGASLYLKFSDEEYSALNKVKYLLSLKMGKSMTNLSTVNYLVSNFLKGVEDK